MEPVGWVSCGCGKGVTLYARKQQVKQTVETVVDQLRKSEPALEVDGMTLPLPEKSALSVGAERKARVQQRLCKYCGKSYKASASNYVYCTWDCYCKKKRAQKEAERLVVRDEAEQAAVDHFVDPTLTEETLKELEQEQGS